MNLGPSRDASPHPDVVRLAAFADGPNGGNPAGVSIGATLPAPAEMLQIAADIGYSETAFLAPAGPRRWTVRYYSPRAEVSFCGHATVAAAIALGRQDGPGTFEFLTAVGSVPVTVRAAADDSLEATLTSVEPQVRPCSDALLTSILDAFGWSSDDLDPALPPALSNAGAWHLVLALRDHRTLQTMDYDFAALLAAMATENLTTIQAIWRKDSHTFHARNPFPVGGVVEDPATGAAAAALGAYLRAFELIDPPDAFTVHQGHEIGRPSVLHVGVPTGAGGVQVTGTAAAIDDEPG